MTRTEFVAVLAPLTIAFRVEFDQPAWTVYFRALKDVPVHLLHLAVDALAKQDRAFMPKPGEVRAEAERARLAVRAAHPYDGCCECEDSKGWRTVRVDGVERQQRCPCWDRYQHTLARLGVHGGPLALPPATSGELVRVGEVE